MIIWFTFDLLKDHWFDSHKLPKSNSNIKKLIYLEKSFRTKDLEAEPKGSCSHHLESKAPRHWLILRCTYNLQQWLQLHLQQNVG